MLRCVDKGNYTHGEPVRRQCELIGLNRSTYYLEPAGESLFNMMLMRLIDEQYMKTPLVVSNFIFIRERANRGRFQSNIGQ